jgi:hypothetical protein
VKRERRPGLDVDTAGRFEVHLWLERDCEGCALACQSCGRHAACSSKDNLSPGDGDALRGTIILHHPFNRRYVCRNR